MKYFKNINFMSYKLILHSLNEDNPHGRTEFCKLMIESFIKNRVEQEIFMDLASRQTFQTFSL